MQLVHSVLTEALHQHLLALGEPTTENYIEALYGSDGLMERYDLDTKVDVFIQNEEQAERPPAHVERGLSWETTRLRWANAWIDYVNWGKAGRFGAYALATFAAPVDQALSALLVPCAPKAAAVQYALEGAAGLSSHTRMLLQLHPPHDGADGKATQRYPTFPNKPMSAQECVDMRPLLSESSDASGESSESS